MPVRSSLAHPMTPTGEYEKVFELWMKLFYDYHFGVDNNYIDLQLIGNLKKIKN